MAIKYPGQQKIGYGKAQIFDTSKLAEGAWKAGAMITEKRKEKKKAKDEFVKNLKDIDVSNIRRVDTEYITENVNAVSEYFYKNSAAILNPKLDGGKAAMEVQRLKSFAVGEVQRSIGIKEEDKILDDRITSDKDHFGTHENYTLHNTRISTPMNDKMWEDHETPETYTQVDVSMTEEEKTDFFSKSKSEQSKILKSRIPAQTKLDDYNSLETAKEKQEWLLANNYKLPKYGADGDFGGESKAAEEEFLKDVNTSIETQTARIDADGTADITNYENYTEYSEQFGAINPGFNAGLLNEQEFDNLKEEYNQYETTWNESQGTFEVKTEGGETIVGLHNRQLNANPMLGEHIQGVAKDIQFNETEISKIAVERVGEGSVHLFETKKEVATEHIVNTIMGSIKGHRFNPEMMKELNTELSERQKENENFTLEDLVLEKAQGYIKNESKINFVKDIFKPRGNTTSVKVYGNKPSPDEFAVSLPSYDDRIKVGSSQGSAAIGIYGEMDWSYGMLNEGTVGGVTVGGADISQVAKGEGGASDVIEIRTSKKGYRQLYGTNDKYNNLHWKGRSETIKLNPQFIFPAAAFKNDITINGIEFKAGDRVPTDIEDDGIVRTNFSSYLPTVNQDGEYEFPDGVEMKYFLQGTIIKEGGQKGSNQPIIIEYGKDAGTVWGAVNSYIQRQSNSKTAFDVMNRNLLGYSGTNRAN